MITYDETQRSVLALCECGAREVLWSKAAAYRWADDHLGVCSLLGQERERALAAVRAGRARYR